MFSASTLRDECDDDIHDGTTMNDNVLPRFRSLPFRNCIMYICIAREEEEEEDILQSVFFFFSFDGIVVLVVYRIWEEFTDTIESRSKKVYWYIVTIIYYNELLIIICYKDINNG